MREWLIQYWLEALFGLMIAGGGCALRILYGKIKESDTRQKAVENGIQALLRDRLVQSYYHYSEREWITMHGLEACEKMYKEYHNLGGNGMVTKLMDDIRELPVKDGAKERT